MNETNSRRSPIGRILVALDASASSMNALHAAVDLAGRFKAEVLGLFVEDINLLRLAEWPFAREISFFGPGPREIDPLHMALQLRIQADRIRDTLARIADRSGIRWEFRTVRGDVGSQVLSAAADIDLVVLGKIGRSLPGAQRTGSTVRALLLQRQGMTLIMQTQVLFTGSPVAVVCDGSPAAGRALETACDLAQRHAAPMIVFVIGDSGEALEAHREQARERLRSRGVEARFYAVLKPTATELALRIQRETRGPVILPCLQAWFAGESLCGLIDAIANSVLLIR
jgi:nucleotide-binding universal stress UspA family protein